MKEKVGGFYYKSKVFLLQIKGFVTPLPERKSR